MRLLLDDTLVTAPWVVPLTEGWVTPEGEVQARTGLSASDVGVDDVALVPAGEVPALMGSHSILPEVAVVSGQSGAVVMRVPVRPDEIGSTPVRLWRTSRTAALLARATLRPFYGIEPTTLTTAEDPAAQVVIVEGVEALREPEGGYAEDLCRAWFILTGLPAVSHVTVVPNESTTVGLDPAIGALTALRAAGHDRRRDLRGLLAERHGLGRDRVAAVLGSQRHALTPDDRRSLAQLLSMSPHYAVPG